MYENRGKWLEVNDGAQNLKSRDSKESYRFDSDLGHHALSGDRRGDGAWQGVSAAVWGIRKAL
jgi:hypothetical protein